MLLIEQWDKYAYNQKTQSEYDEFWNKYLPKEQHVYEKILSKKITSLKGKFSQLAEEFGMSILDFTGFMLGINTSLVNPIEMEKLEEDSEINAEIDFEKLYYNMLDAKADWLYNLPQWDDILSVEKRKEIKAAYNCTKTVVKGEKIGRNDPCPCGSGKKYKKCCGK